LSSSDEKLTMIGVFIFLVLATPIALYLLAVFNIYPNQPILGTWKGNIDYFDSASNSTVGATFTFTNDGICTITWDETIYSDESSYTYSINKSAEWKEDNNIYYLLYGSNKTIMYLQNINNQYSLQNFKQLVLSDDTVDGKESPFHGYITQRN